MYALAFDLVVADTEQHHPRGVSQAYSEIGAILAGHGFRRVQGSLYLTGDENMANLFQNLFTAQTGVAQVPIRDGMQGAVLAHSLSYGQVPQRRRPPEGASARLPSGQ